MKNKNYDNFTIEQIHEMIAKGITTNQEVVDFYGNEWWDDISVEQCIEQLQKRLGDFKHTMYPHFDNNAIGDCFALETESGNIYKFYLPNWQYDTFMIDFSPLYKGTIEEFKTWQSALGYFVEQVENENV